jgi:opacity protein-like surface antigen
MKKVLSVLAVSAFVLTAGVALAGGPGKKMGPGCPEACQKQIDDLNSSQAQQNEQLGAHSKTLQNHEGRITDLEKAFNDAWYVRLGARAGWGSQDLGFAGISVVDDWDTDVQWGGTIAFGREFAMYKALGKFRAEVEVGYQSGDLDDLSYDYIPLIYDRRLELYNVSGDVSVLTVMINGYYEIPVYEAFSLYAMVGVGMAKYELEASVYGVDTDVDGGYNEVDDSRSLLNHSMDDTVFAYKAGVGMTYNFTDEIAGDLGYEYLGMTDADVVESIASHNIVASVRFKF